MHGHHGAIYAGRRLDSNDDCAVSVCTIERSAIRWFPLAIRFITRPAAQETMRMGNLDIQARTGETGTVGFKKRNPDQALCWSVKPGL